MQKLQIISIDILRFDWIIVQSMYRTTSMDCCTPNKYYQRAFQMFLALYFLGLLEIYYIYHTLLLIPWLCHPQRVFLFAARVHTWRWILMLCYMFCMLWISKYKTIIVVLPSNHLSNEISCIQTSFILFLLKSRQGHIKYFVFYWVGFLLTCSITVQRNHNLYLSEITVLSYILAVPTILPQKGYAL